MFSFENFYIQSKRIFFMFEKDNKGRVSVTLLFGFLGIIAPIVSVYVATFLGKSDLSVINSSLIMFLSALLIVFLIINCFSNFIKNNKRSFILGLILLLLSIYSFISNMLIFITL